MKSRADTFSTPPHITTTSLIGHILRESGVSVQVGGNIGLPVTAMVDTSREDGWNVLELSSFQTETIGEFRAQIALALNVTQNHLDRHHTFENYAAAQGRLFETQRPGDTAILNADDAVCVGYAARTLATPAWFSSRREVAPGAWLRGETLVVDAQVLMEAGEIPIRGRHNVENVLAASLAALRAGVPHAHIAAAVRTFRAVEHRLEFVREREGVKWYNDSIASAPERVTAALRSFDEPVVLLLGGRDKKLPWGPLADLARTRVKHLVLLGEARALIQRALEAAGVAPGAYTVCERLREAVDVAARVSAPGDIVLLSPGCTSFDEFQDFAERGEKFKAWVRHL